MSVADEPPAMNQRRKAHLSQPPKAQAAEITLFPTAPERNRQDFLGEPAIQEPELRLIVHVLEIIVEDRHVAHPSVDGPAHHINRQARSFLSVFDPRKPRPSLSQRKAKQVANLSEFIAESPISPPGLNSRPRWRNLLAQENCGSATGLGANATSN